MDGAPSSSSRKKATKTGGLLPWRVGLANFVRRTRNGARICVAPQWTKNRPRAQPRPKITARRPGRQKITIRPAEKGHKNGWAIALRGGAGPLRPPDSEWRENFRVACVCQKKAAGTGAPKNNSPKARAPKNNSSSSRKRPQKRVGYSLGGWGWPTSSALLGMARDFVRRLLVPEIGRGHIRAQK